MQPDREKQQARCETKSQVDALLQYVERESKGRRRHLVLRKRLLERKRRNAEGACCIGTHNWTSVYTVITRFHELLSQIHDIFLATYLLMYLTGRVYHAQSSYVFRLHFPLNLDP